jgi:hypothetical protein
MTLAIAYNPPLDLFAAWQASNGAVRCNRMGATITAVDCERNRNQTYVDCRCSGCGGLDNQAAPLQQSPPSLALVWDAGKEADGSPEADDGDVTKINTADQRVCSFDDEEIENLLAEMFPVDDMDEDEGEEYPERTYIEDPPEAKGRRVLVYTGCCTRCGGYMTNDREKQFDVRDEDVYRCFTCGWRTSPRYANNRALFARGLEIR